MIGQDGNGWKQTKHTQRIRCNVFRQMLPKWADMRNVSHSNQIILCLCECTRLWKPYASMPKHKNMQHFNTQTTPLRPIHSSEGLFERIRNYDSVSCNFSIVISIVQIHRCVVLQNQNVCCLDRSIHPPCKYMDKSQHSKSIPKLCLCNLLLRLDCSLNIWQISGCKQIIFKTRR